MKLDRRDFLRTAAAGAAVLTLAPAALAAADDRDAPRPTALAAPAALLATLGADAVRRIAASYLATLVPDERDARVLHARLATHPIAAAITDDYAAGRTVVVDGWVLSATEARQCALFWMRG